VAHALTLRWRRCMWALPTRLWNQPSRRRDFRGAGTTWRPLFMAYLGVAFGFGLVHGFGFANALEGLGLGRDVLALALWASTSSRNGQLVIVGLFLPLAYALRRSWFINT